MSEIAIIGGSGFVGSLLTSKLNKSSVRIFDKNESPFFNDITSIVDIRNYDELNFNTKTKSVVLLAAEHRDDVSPVSLYYDVNVEGTKNVLNAMDKAGIKNLIFTSSVAIYGLNKDNTSEDSSKDPFNHYGKSKLMAENIIIDWYNSNPHGKSITILRPTVIFGERNRGNVYNLLKQISSGRFLMIGNGKNKKSMAYIGNIVAFIKERLESLELGLNIYNYSDKPDLTMKELVSLIEKKMNLSMPKFKIPFWLGMLVGYFYDFANFFLNKKSVISSVRVKKFCATTQFNAEKVNTVFKPPYTLLDGLNITLEQEFIVQKNDDIVFYSE